MQILTKLVARILIIFAIIIIFSPFTGSFPSVSAQDNSSGIVSDDFNACTLDGGLWTLVDPVGDSILSMNGTQALLSVPEGVGHDVWTKGNLAPRLMQAAADTDFEVEVKFESTLDTAYQLQGILVEADADNFLRLNFHSDNKSTRIFAAKFENGRPKTFVNTVIGDTGIAPLYMRVTRVGDLWTLAYSEDGTTWTVAVDSYAHTLTVTGVGVFAGNAGGAKPAHTAIIDYFFNTASPINPEDANGGTTLAVNVSGSGSVAQVPDLTTYACGEAVELTATADPGWVFDSWGGDLIGSANPATVVMDGDKVITAMFLDTGAPTYGLTVNTIGSGSVEANPDQAVYIEGQIVELTATADPGWVFDSWGGDLTGSANPATLTMDSDKVVTATFVEVITYQLTANTVGNGTVAANPDQAIYNEGQVVELTATADPGWVFDSWSGDLSGSANPATVTMDSDKVVTATFVEDIDVDPPVISNVQVTPGITSAVVTWTTDEPATSSVAYGPSAAYENGTVDDLALVTNHSINLTGLSANSLYHYQPRSTDGSGNMAIGSDDTFTTQDVPGGDGPVIDIWYGSQQSFGHLGSPQPWVNLLGNVSDVDGVSSLTYSLNGGPERALSIGRDGKRLQDWGDFNIDIHQDDLLDGLNQVEITATDDLGNVSVEPMTIQYTAGNIWPLPYSIDWSTVNDIQDVAQVVDGIWSMQGDNLRTIQVGYDRLVAIGDVTWTDYEVQVPVIIHDFGPGGAVGVGVRWKGHTDDPHAGWQPKTGFRPLGGAGVYAWANDEIGTRLKIWGDGGGAITEDLSGRKLDNNVTYIFKMRGESIQNQQGDLVPQYSFKVWEEGQPEPQGWDLTVQEGSNNSLNGSVLLLAHRVDAEFGDVTITPILDSDGPVISNINVVPGETTATVTWTTNEPATSQVAYGPTSAYEDGTVSDSALVTQHSITLSGLTAQMQYHYQITSTDGNGNTSTTQDAVFSTSGGAGTTYTLTVTTEGNGTVGANPDQTTYSEGQLVELTAMADPGWAFDSWSGDLTGNSNPATVLMDSDKVVTATFVTDVIPPTISDVQVTPGTTSAVVTWTTDEPATSSVAYGPSAAYENGTVENLALVTEHSITLTGLSADSLYHYQVRSVDGGGNEAIGADGTFMTLDGSNPSGIVSDDFNACTLDGGLWTLVDPVGDSSLSMNGTQALLSVPAGVGHDVWTQGNFAPRLMQAAADTDFEIEVKFESSVDSAYQLQGILVEADADNFLRLDFHSTNSSTKIFAAKFENGRPTAFVNTVIGGTGLAPLHMRVTRVGDLWTVAYSLDGANWTVAVDGYAHTLAVTGVGVFVGNAGGAKPAHTAIIDYFFNTASPINPEDPTAVSCN